MIHRKDHLVQALLDHFDENQDGCLNFDELAALQLATSGAPLTENNYVMVCKTLNCPPHSGLTLTALKLTYAAEGTNLEEDYTKVFGKPADKVLSKGDHDDDVYEIGDDGVDISS